MEKLVFDLVTGRKKNLTFSSVLTSKKPQEDIPPWRRLTKMFIKCFPILEKQSKFSEALRQVKKQHYIIIM